MNVIFLEFNVRIWLNLGQILVILTGYVLTPACEIGNITAQNSQDKDFYDYLRKQNIKYEANQSYWL